MNAPEARETVEILLVEDNAGDVRLTQEALKINACEHVLHVARDGEEAMDFLQAAPAEDAPGRPDLILLDLNLPRMNGHEVLTHVKQDPNLAEIPVVMLTTSRAEKDVRESYRRHASSYVTKPVDLDGFIDLIGDLRHYWMQIAVLPSRA